MGERNASPEEILDYWKGYYTGRSPVTGPSFFALWVKPQLIGTTVDIGCGDGRDTKYLNAIGIDPATVGGDVHNLPKADNYYARFFFHAVPEDIEDLVLDQIDTKLFAEMRADGDESFTPDHYRRPINPNNFIVKLIDREFSIKYVEVGHGLAILGDQDPLIFRVAAEK